MKFTLDDAVKRRPFVTKTVLPCAERSEVLRSLWHIICKPEQREQIPRAINGAIAA